MKILIVHPGPQFSVHDVYAGWVAALRNLGQQVIEYNLCDRLNFYGTVLKEHRPGTFVRALTNDQATELAINGLYSTLYKTQPDVLLVVSAFFVGAELLELARARGTAVVLLHTESPYEDERQLALAAHADLNLLNDPINIDRYREHSKAVYVPHAYRPDIHYPGALGDGGLEHDFVFAGTGYASRIAFFAAMGLADMGIDAVLAGHWGLVDDDCALLPLLAHDRGECLDNERAADLYRGAKIGLNLYRREAQNVGLVNGWAMGPREVEMAACGLFFVRDPRGEGDETLHMLPTFASPQEASELLHWYLDHDAQRVKAAVCAREAIAERTFDHYAAALLRLIIK